MQYRPQVKQSGFSLHNYVSLQSAQKSKVYLGLHMTWPGGRDSNKGKKSKRNWCISGLFGLIQNSMNTFSDLFYFSNSMETSSANPTDIVVFMPYPSIYEISRVGVARSLPNPPSVNVKLLIGCAVSAISIKTFAPAC